MKISEQKLVPIVSRIRCDRCGIGVPVEDLEAAEFFSCSFTGGYTSIFGDGFKGEVDLCQYCFKLLMSPYIRET